LYAFCIPSLRLRYTKSIGREKDKKKILKAYCFLVLLRKIIAAVILCAAIILFAAWLIKIKDKGHKKHTALWFYVVKQGLFKSSWYFKRYEQGIQAALAVCAARDTGCA